MTARLWPGDEAGVRQAAFHLARGEVVGFPTDTVYGLAASARMGSALQRISQLKGRPLEQPLILMTSSQLELEEFVIWSEPARRLADRFWPGPLTLILPSREQGRPLGGRGTVGVRIPDLPLALRLLAASGPLGTTSANRHGMPPARDAAEALSQLPGLAGALEGGSELPAHHKPSSILDLTQERPVLLREGSLSRDELLVALQPGHSEE